MRARVVVIGGGIMGLCVARELARRFDPLEDPVVLLERRAFGAGSSGRSGAILRCHYADREVAAMARDSLRWYAGCEARTGRGIGFEACGVLTLAGPEALDARERIARNTAMLRELGVAAELCDARRMRELVPGIEVREGSTGCHEPAGGFVDPAACLAACAALARERGAALWVGREVEELLLSNGRVLGVRATQGEIQAPAVVLACGPWTRSLLSRHGIDLPLEVVRPENCHLEREPRAPARLGGPARAAHPVLIDLEHGYYARCDPQRSRTRIGAIEHGREQRLAHPEPLEEAVSDEMRRFARSALAARLPSYAAAAEGEALAAWYTLTPDHQPVLGAWPEIEGLYLAAGFSGHGFKLAPSVGEGLAQLVCGEAPSAFDAAFFAPERLRGGALRRAAAFGL